MNIDDLNYEQSIAMMEKLERHQDQLAEVQLPALLSMIRRLVQTGHLTRKDLLANSVASLKVRLPMKYYDPSSGNAWSGKGPAKPPFTTASKEKNLGQYLIPDEIANKVALETGRDVFTKTKKLVKYVSKVMASPDSAS